MSVALQIIIPLALLTGLALVFSIIIAIFSKKFAVEVNPKIELVENLLSGANCGACGYAGCSAFAKALVEGDATLPSCSATSKESKEEIAKILGSDDIGESTVVIVACNGGNSCQNKYSYQGYGDCASVELLAGGSKACPIGCIGMSKCIMECPHHAIELNEGHAMVKQEACVQCGVCISHCPKKLIKRLPSKAIYYIACSSQDRGKEVRSYCKNGCIGCRICVKNCKENALSFENNLPVFDYDKCTACGVCFEKCPAKCIKKLDI